jgi:hypothetical protein
MPNVTAEFAQQQTRKAFLGSKIVLVGEPRDPSSGPRSFWFDEGNGYVKLKAGSPAADAADKTTVSAYWLPWNPNAIAVLDLAGGADFFFTSQMTGCIFKVLTSSSTNPKVAHIPGTMLTSKQNQAETEILKNVPETDRKSGKGGVLSIAGGEEHGYSGQSAKDDLGKLNPGSAFVFGFKDENGHWTFQAQIVKANLADENAFRIGLKSGVPRIAELFEFK